ncbi:MAG TPA: putative metal-binding motif-containing protein [Polyangia bacterium]|nr:putative metal-binding motif-containing protein [Polyangia bacterium]
MLLTVTADAPVEQYQLFLHDDDAAQIVYSSGFIPVSAPGQQLDLTMEPLKLALKLSRGGHFTLLLVGVIGEVDDGKPAASATSLFWAGKLHVDGPLDVNARLLTVPPGDDADGDYFPDATDFPAHVPEAATLYANHADVLDCNDKDNMPTAADGTPLVLMAKDINPFATEICGDGYDEDCNGDTDEACVDKDGDGDVHGHDCDDNDPKRHHPTPMDPYPDPPNCCGYSLGKINTPDEHTNFLGDPVLCPMQRCGDGIDESCRGVENDPKNDTTCIVDADCDGYPATVNGQPYDCDDNDPTVHPGAVEPCGSTRDLNCNGTVGEGCVPCDLDGDGYERSDPTNNCPDANDKHPGMVDCNDDDAGVHPGATTVAGGVEGGSNSVAKIAAALSGFCRGIYQPTGTTGTAKINPFGGMVGDADCNGTAYEGCPALIDPGCDVDGDGWPGVAMSNGKNCNPGNVTLDCDDNDPTTFPSAPINCKMTTGTYKNNCSPQGPADCSQDADGDGYSKPADCDDNDPSVHPFAVELCDGKDNDCDGIVDEGNPDPTGAPLVSSGAITTCTDSNTGECAKGLGTCVCSVAKPVVDPSIAGATRVVCPGETAAGKVTGCFGAGQPKPQSCDPANPKDDDCDGRVDAPDGKNLAVKGMTCGITVGQCKAGIVVGCDMTQTNCFESFGRTAASTAWYVCSSAAPDPVTVCPMAEQCNGLDDDCDGTLAGAVIPPIPGLPTNDERDHDGDHYLACSGCGATLGAGILGCSDCNDTVPTVHPGATEICNGIDDSCAGAAFADGKDDCGKGGNATKPTCCGGNGCRDTTSDYQFCGSCGNNCGTSMATTTNECYNSSCSCASGGACTGGLTCQGAAPGGMCVAGNGSTCTADNQCSSGHCTDGHCCGVGSCGTCAACTGAGGTCVAQPSGMPGNMCPDASGDTVCDGGAYPNGKCKKNIGQACGGNSECFNGLCVDGYCCNSACNGQCQQCNGATPGTCSTVTSGQPVGGRAACTGSGTCQGTCDGTSANACHYPGGGTTCGTQTCAAAGTGAVVTPVGACNGAGSCTQTPSAPCIYTQCNGNVCATTCADDNGCINADYCSSTGSGSCVGRHGSGISCVSEDCEKSPCNYCAAGAGCKASGQCCTSACAGPSCTSGTLTTHTCNAAGMCQAAMTSCNGYACNGAVCGTTCASDTDCATGYYCMAMMPNPVCVQANLNKNDTCNCQQAGCHACTSGMACDAMDKCP